MYAFYADVVRLIAKLNGGPPISGRDYPTTSPPSALGTCFVLWL
jgi:hypothetical protein